MDRRRNQHRAVRNMVLTAIGVLVTASVGLGASSYTVSNINPIYFGSLESRRAQPLSNNMDPAYSTPPSFPSMPGDQYYYYRPPPVTASYDAVPPAETTDVNLPAEPDRSSRNQTVDDEDGAVPAADDEAARDEMDVIPASDAPVPPEANESVAVRVLPEPQPN